MILLDIYIIVGLIVTVVLMLTVRYGDFDKFVHDTTNGMVEFTWTDKITVPIIVGVTWPYAAWVLVRKYVHG